MPPDEPPLAFIYDRRLTPALGILRLRLENCREYAAESRWEIAGEWVDVGDDAMSDDRRPEFDNMIVAMRAAHASGRTVLCLLNDWDRMTRDAHRQAAFRHEVSLAGGYTVTSLGEDSRSRAGSSLRAMRPA